MIVTWHDSGLPPVFGGNITSGFSFCDPAQIEQPAPIKYHIAQKYRAWLLRDKPPTWFEWNEHWAHTFYLAKRSWYSTFV